MNPVLRMGVFGAGGGAAAAAARDRVAPLRRSYVVELVRFDRARERVRVLLDDASRIGLHPQLDEKIEFEATWRDGLYVIAVTVVAIHRDGFVDLAGAQIDNAPQRIRLRRYPEHMRAANR